MNNLNVTGRLTKDAELSYIKGTGTPVAKFYVAVERKFQSDNNNKKIDYIPCELIGKVAEKLTQYLVKGSLVNVIGEIHLYDYQTESGEKRIFTKMHVENIRLLSSPKKQEFTPTNDLPF